MGRVLLVAVAIVAEQACCSPPPASGICRGVFSQQKWCDPTRSIGERVEDMISRMALEDKIASLASSDNAVPSLGLPSYNWRSEANNGLVRARICVCCINAAWAGHVE